ncbi:hypothetical protein F4802DRAFT_21175 [Xylaria palmicola]|nr:hypothetical protein F4802DRAFT_21175 [Xylaria palmicola]
MPAQTFAQIVIGALQLGIATAQFIVTIFAWLGARRFQRPAARGNDAEHPPREFQPVVVAHEQAQENTNNN